MKHLKSKRGIAFENAILFMVVVFTLCTLLASLVIIGNYRAQAAQKSFLKRVEMEQIVEDFVDALDTEDGPRDGEKDFYTYEVTGYEKDKSATLTVYENSNEKVRITAEKIEGVWKYTR